VVATLVGLLLLGGVYDEYVFAFLTPLWQKILGALGLSQQIGALQQGINANVTQRSLLAAATYAALYVAICLLILYLVLQNRQQWQLAFRLYAGVAVAYVLLVIIGKLAGNAFWAYKLSRHLIDFLASPIPVAGLIVLFKAGFGPQNSQNESAS
jgi:uncharacterized integral membrane protein